MNEIRDFIFFTGLNKSDPQDRDLIRRNRLDFTDTLDFFAVNFTDNL